jgi:hypothetical protein
MMAPRNIVGIPIFGVRTILLTALFAIVFSARANAGPDPVLSEHLFDDANGAFLSGDLPRATAAYQALLEEGVVSVELETNLATALLRENQRGLAALHYERALFLDPGDDDARADLVELRRNNVDRLEGESDDGGSDALFRVFAPLPGKAAAILLIASWALACLFAGARRFSTAFAARRETATAAWFFLALAALSALLSFASSESYKVALRRGVMTAASTPAREGPQAKAASSFEVHEGTLVRVEDEQSGFARVRLANGLTGWVPSDSVERVVLPRWGGAN